MLVWKSAGHQEVHLGAAMLPHMLAADFTAAQARSPDSYTNWGTEEHGRPQVPGLTGWPLGFHIRFMQQSGEGASGGFASNACKQSRLLTGCLGTGVMSLRQITSLVDTVNLFFVKKTQKEQLLSYYHSCLKAITQILPATAFNSASYGLNSLWS